VLGLCYCINCILPTNINCLSCLVRFSPLHTPFYSYLCSHFRFLSGSVIFILQFRHSSPVCQATRQCNVLSSAIPGHRPQALLNTSGPIAMGSSNPSLWSTPTFPRLSPLHKRHNASSHAIPSPPPELHLTLSLSTFEWRCLRQRSWSNPRRRAGFTGERLQSNHHTPLAAAVTQMRGASLFPRIIGPFFESIFLFSADDSCLSVPSSSRSRQRHGLSHHNKVRNSHHKSQ